MPARRTSVIDALIHTWDPDGYSAALVRYQDGDGHPVLVSTDSLAEVSGEEGDRLLQHLYDQAVIPEYQCRLHWDKNSIAFWDNRAVQHYAASDYWPQPRVMERVTVIGDRPA